MDEFDRIAAGDIGLGLSYDWTALGAGMDLPGDGTDLSNVANGSGQQFMATRAPAPMFENGNFGQVNQFSYGINDLSSLGQSTSASFSNFANGHGQQFMATRAPAANLKSFDLSYGAFQQSFVPPQANMGYPSPLQGQNFQYAQVQQNLTTQHPISNFGNQFHTMSPATAVAPPLHGQNFQYAHVQHNLATHHPVSNFGNNFQPTSPALASPSPLRRQIFPNAHVQHNLGFQRPVSTSESFCQMPSPAPANSTTLRAQNFPNAHVQHNLGFQRPVLTPESTPMVRTDSGISMTDSRKRPHQQMTPVGAVVDLTTKSPSKKRKIAQPKTLNDTVVRDTIKTAKIRSPVKQSPQTPKQTNTANNLQSNEGLMLFKMLAQGAQQNLGRQSAAIPELPITPPDSRHGLSAPSSISESPDLATLLRAEIDHIDAVENENLPLNYIKVGDDEYIDGVYVMKSAVGYKGPRT